MKKIATIIFIISAALCSCTENERAKSWGGTQTIKINPNHKLLMVTWKEDQMWILTQDTITKQYSFHEKSAFGVVEGEVKFKY